MSVWYRMTDWMKAPEPVIVVGDSDKFVTIECIVGGLKAIHREAKDTDQSAIRHTVIECLDWLVDRRRKEADKAESVLERARERFHEADSMRRKAIED